MESPSYYPSMQPDPLLDHLEKTFAEAYRKELDQEENVWRSLPFFAAALALQLAGLAQLHDWVQATSGLQRSLVDSLLLVAGLASAAAITGLGMTVWPADYRYVGDEPGLARYANEVKRMAKEGSRPDPVSDALTAVKTSLLTQYAACADNNRRLNRRRNRWRAVAGLSTIASIISILVLVAFAMVSNMYAHAS